MINKVIIAAMATIIYCSCLDQAALAAPIPIPVVVDRAVDPIADTALSDGTATRHYTGETRGFAAFWLPVYGLAAVALLALAYQNYFARRQQRIEHAETIARKFNSNQSVQKIMDILDFEEYRKQYYKDLATNEIKQFEVTDHLVRQSLRTHDDMVRISNWLSNMEDEDKKRKWSSEEWSKYCRYRDEIYPAQVELRAWFNTFLWELEAINAAMEVGLIKLSDIKPYIEYWIQVIADRSVRRKGGSSFYDSLYQYIYRSGFNGVIDLFKRFGYSIIPPIYNSADLNCFTEDKGAADHKSNLEKALTCAKMCMLAYEDKAYITDIVRLMRAESVNKNEAGDVVQELIDADLKAEGKRSMEAEDSEMVKFIEDKEKDTQALIFRYDGNQAQDPVVVLAFRGTEKLEDWKTNLKRRQIEWIDPGDAKQDNKGFVHEGFKIALDCFWQHTEIEATIRKFCDDKSCTPQIWITGHSLGGALAVLAAVKLKQVCREIKIGGIYTFGQPRTGNPQFCQWAGQTFKKPHLSDRNISYHRFVNNNDIVSRIPVPLLPPRRYDHFGIKHYISANGFVSIDRISWLFNLVDRLRGSLQAWFIQRRPDMIADHDIDQYISNIGKSLDQNPSGNLWTFLGLLFRGK